MASKKKPVAKAKKVSRKSVNRTVHSSKASKNSHTLLMLAIAAVLVASSYIIFSDSWKSSMAPSKTSSEKSYYVKLSSQGGSKEEGTALFTEMGNQTHVRIELSNTPSGVEQPAHIYLGTCANLGAITYPLSNVVNGISDTMIDTTIAKLKAAGPLSLNAHKSATEMNRHVSCGDLVF